MTTETTKQEYAPFGEEWKAEMKKWSKDMLIDCLRHHLIEKQNLVASHADLMEALEKVRHWIEDPSGDEETTTEEIINMLKSALSKGEGGKA